MKADYERLNIDHGRVAQMLQLGSGQVYSGMVLRGEDGNPQMYFGVRSSDSPAMGNWAPVTPREVHALARYSRNGGSNPAAAEALSHLAGRFMAARTEPGVLAGLVPASALAGKVVGPRCGSFDHGYNAGD